LTCNTILDRMIERFQLMRVYKAKYMEDGRRSLLGQAIIQVDKKSGIISVQVTDKDAKRSAMLANGFLEELDKLLQDLVAQEARGHLVFLEKELSNASLNLSKAEEALRSFSQKNNVIQLDTQTRGTLEYIARLRAEIDIKEVYIGVMRYQATPRNVEMVRLEKELAGLKEKLKAVECNQIPDSNICLTTDKVPTLGLEYMRLYRDYKFQEGLYQLYFKMVELARVDMVKDVASVQILDKATPPEKRSNVRLFPSLICGMTLFLLMLSGVWCREVWEDWEKSMSQQESQRWALFVSYLEPWQQSGRRIMSFLKRRKAGLS
jgi:tyrosine-protein kinase Etk/Wzc